MQDEPLAFRTFYRIVKVNPPTRQDFLSAQALGRTVPRGDPELARLWDGLSVWQTEAQARRKARGVPEIGEYIAELQFPDDGSLRYRRTLQSRGHHTLWVDPDVALARVISVVPVEGSAEG